jgi:hypothetical protein
MSTLQSENPISLCADSIFPISNFLTGNRKALPSTFLIIGETDRNREGFPSSSLKMEMEGIGTRVENRTRDNGFGDRSFSTKLHGHWCVGRDSNPQRFYVTGLQPAATLTIFAAYASPRPDIRPRYFRYWCPRQDSNLQMLSHQTLSLAWLPISPRGHLVRSVGVEPTNRLKAPDPESGVATNFTTSANSGASPRGRTGTVSQRRLKAPRLPISPERLVPAEGLEPPSRTDFKSAASTFPPRRHHVVLAEVMGVEPIEPFGPAA